MTIWRPIEDAPKDRPVLLWARLKMDRSDDHYPIVGFWHAPVERWNAYPEHLNGQETLNPSHWAELPEPPKEDRP
jgi:hypothetical protein